MNKEAKNIKLLLLDVDGVLTDGSIWLDKDGYEIKRFNVRDGFALKKLQKNGIQVGIITGRRSKSLEHRLQELQIDLVYQKVKNKLEIYDKILCDLKLDDSQVAYIGDDIPDICVLKRVALPAAPNDAAKEVKEVAKFICDKNGGHGAVRELGEFILKSQNKWNL